jgi:small-conductance mechanosensitive channel
MSEAVINIGWAVLFSIVGGLVGMAMVLLASAALPRILERFTPNLDEGKEIARGNVAVAQYFGRIVGAGIIGVSIVAAAAVLGGILAALH